MKRAHLPFALVLFLGVIILGGNATAVLQCSDLIASPAFGGTEIVRLSTSDNAHGSMPASLGGTVPYPVSIRCKESGGASVTVAASGTNEVLHLSSIDNAHAEFYSQANYTTKIILNATPGGILTQIAGPGMPQLTCNGYDNLPSIDYVEVVRLSSLTNAHLESPFSETSGPLTADYEYTLCAAYTATAVSIGDVISAGFTGGEVSSIDSTTPIVATGTVNKTLSDPTATNTRTLLIYTICDATDPLSKCAQSYNQTTYLNELYADSPASPSIFLNRQGHHYGLLSDPYTLFPVPIATADILNLNAGNLEGQTTPNMASTTYTIDPSPAGLNLIPGNTYRIHMVALPGEFNHPVLGNNQFEEPGGASANYVNNFDYFDFTVTGGTGPGPTNGSGGDVFILKNIDYAPNPPIEGKQFDALITIQNKRTDLTTNGTLNVIIRDGDGKEIPGFNPATTPVSFPLPASGTNAEITQPVTIEFDSDSIGAFAPGQTYTLYATITPFDDTTPPINEDDETVTGNNSAFKTFTVLEPQTTLNVPDAPPWMSVFMALIVLGWLFVSSRKEDQE